MELVLDSLLDALKDGALSIPILFLAYLLMELLERSKKLDESILHAYSRKAGPALGGLLGAIPQCGISGAAATLFSTGTITVGTMLAVFFATSDEMLPVMLSGRQRHRHGEHPAHCGGQGGPRHCPGLSGGSELRTLFPPGQGYPLLL